MGSNSWSFKVACVIIMGIGLTGCGDVTGDAPKIASADEKKQAGEASTAVTPPPTPSATPAGGWNEVAQNAFADQVQTTAPTLSPATTVTTAPSVSAQPALPALSAPSPELAESPSLYLRQAQNSGIYWQTWTQGTFQQAQSRNVPILLIIGAAWNHQAQAMDNHVFADTTVGEAINKHFIPVRVDADDRSDIWSRYRMAYEVINKERATIPLVVFALPDGRPFDIISAVPAHTDGGNVGMTEILAQASSIYSQQPDTVIQQADAIKKVLSKLLTEPQIESAGSTSQLINNLVDNLTGIVKSDQSEAVRAGRVAGALLTIGAAADKSSARDSASELLLSRFRSGQRDHVMGGYFFGAPGSAAIQFGKVLPVQTEMITANAHAYGLTGKSLHKEAVTEIIRFCEDWLEAPNGGFFSGQTPDTGGNDSAGYFTWTREEIEKIVNEEKAATVFSEYLNAKAGEKTNLHVTGKLQQAADTAGVSYAEANEALNSVRIKLRDARMAAEQTPPVEKSILAGWNGDMICAYLDAAEFVNSDKAKAFALKTADMIIGSMVSEQEGVAHVMYKDRASGFGYLEDNVKVAAGLARCYEVTNQREYIESAISLMEYVEARFLDNESGLYQDILTTPEAPGLLKLKRLPLEDDISRSSNAVGALVWAKLAKEEKKDEYKQRAERMVKAAAERRAFDSEAVATWGEAAAILQYGEPVYKK